jgi:hypothetical protein
LRNDSVGIALFAGAIAQWIAVGSKFSKVHGDVELSSPIVRCQGGFDRDLKLSI